MTEFYISPAVQKTDRPSGKRVSFGGETVKHFESESSSENVSKGQSIFRKFNETVETENVETEQNLKESRKRPRSSRTSAQAINYKESTADSSDSDSDSESDDDESSCAEEALMVPKKKQKVPVLKLGKFMKSKNLEVYDDSQIDFIKSVFQGVTPLVLARYNKLSDSKRNELLFHISACGTEVTKRLHTQPLPKGSGNRQIKNYKGAPARTRYNDDKIKTGMDQLLHLEQEIQRQIEKANELKARDKRLKSKVKDDQQQQLNNIRNGVFSDTIKYNKKNVKQKLLPPDMVSDQPVPAADIQSTSSDILSVLETYLSV